MFRIILLLLYGVFYGEVRAKSWIAEHKGSNSFVIQLPTGITSVLYLVHVIDQKILSTHKVVIH